MALSDKQLDTARILAQSAILADVHAGEDAAAVAQLRSDNADTDDKPAPKGARKNRVATTWMIPRAMTLATDIGCLQFRAGQKIDDAQLKHELEQSGMKLIDVFD